MIETETRAEIFQLRTPLLSKGRLDTVLAETDIMRVWLKTYANGGDYEIKRDLHDPRMVLDSPGEIQPSDILRVIAPLRCFGA